jgi:hypothetical protein
MSQSIKRAILQSFDPSTYTASVLLFEATSYALTGVPVANHIDGSSAIAGSLCALLFFDEHNQQDAVVIATFGNYPAPPPARMTFVASYQQFSNAAISAGALLTTALSGGSSNIPVGAHAVLCKAYFTSATVGAYIQLAPHGADITAYAAIGNIAVASSYLDGMFLLQLDAQGQIDIKANVGNCTVTLYTYGYAQ